MANADGSPTLLDGSAPAAPTTTPPKVTINDTTAKGVWGIFKTGTTTPILSFDSVVDLDYRAEWRIPDYPLEQGSFAAYNKVAMPFQIPVRVAKSGSAADRKTFQTQLEAVAASLDLYDVATPNKTFVGVNIERIGYTQDSRHAQMIVAEIWMKKIRQADDPAYSSTATQSGQDPVSNGSVQPQPATPAQQATVNTGNVSGGW